MADYWKSQPKKFCEFCKCWIADNKPSVEFHEKGKRHRENVQKKIDEMRKRSTEKAKEKEELDEGMAQMEKAALEAFKKDLANDPSLAAQFGVKLKSTRETDVTITGSSKGEVETSEGSTEPAKVREWFEAKSPEGYSYYWNISTNETKWEPPDEYVSLAEQEGQITQDDNKEVSEQQTTEENNMEDLSELEDGVTDEPPQKTLRLDPEGSRSAYGAWETIEREPLPELDLPVEPLLVEDIPLPGEIPEPVEPPALKKDKFKEKVVPSLGGMSDGAVGFKKRKIMSGARNMRQRDDD